MTTQKDKQGLGPVGLSLAALAGMLLAPLAPAQDECGAQAGPVVVCDPAQDYSTSGINYIASGDLTLELTGPGTANLNLGPGARVTATGSDVIGWDSSAFTRTLSGSGAAVLDYEAEDGEIDIQANGFGTGSTYAIRALSRGSGDMRLRLGQAAPSTFIQRGLFIDGSSGSGNIEIDLYNRLQNLGSGAGLDVRSGSGHTRIDLHGSAQIPGNASGDAIRLTAAGDASITLHEGSMVGKPIVLQAAAGTTTTLTSHTVFDSAGDFGGSSATPLIIGSGAGRYVFNQAGGYFVGLDFSANTGGVTVNNHGLGVGAPAAQAWAFTSDGVHFGSGDDVVNNLAGGMIIVSSATNYGGPFSGPPPAVIEARMAFGEGDDRFDNAGIFHVGEARFRMTSTDTLPYMESHPQPTRVVLEDLETFANSGLIVLGGWVRKTPRETVLGSDLICTPYIDFSGSFPVPLPGEGVTCLEQFGDTDADHSNTLSMPGTHFIGSGDSSILLDVSLGLGVAQRDCHARAVQAEGFRLPGADCVDLRGGSTEGVTQLILRDRIPGDLGAYVEDGIVVIDVATGSSAAGHFVLSPQSDGYNAQHDAIDKGLFLFPLVYDAGTQQHKLIAVPGGRAHRLPLLAQSMQALSRTAGRGWFERRDGLRDEARSGQVWMRLTQETGSREARQSVATVGRRFSFDNDYDQDATVFTLGRDVVLGDAWRVGGSASYLNSRVSFAASDARASTDGVAVGLHGSYQQAAFFLDAQLLGSWLQMNYRDARFIDPSVATNALKSGIKSWDARLEMGWRLALGETVYVEPLAAVSWVRSRLDRLTLKSSDYAARPTNTVFGGSHPTSLRAGLGARLGLDRQMAGLDWRLGITARVWDELREDTVVRIETIGDTAQVRDELDGQITELSASLDVGRREGRWVGQLQATGMFGDYESLGLTAGFRYQW